MKAASKSRIEHSNVKKEKKRYSHVISSHAALGYTIVPGPFTCPPSQASSPTFLNTMKRIN